MTTVGLVQINNSFSGQNYLPLSVGMLQAYAQKNLNHPDNYEWLVPIYKRLPIADAVNQLKKADIVFFSVYVWNFQLSLEIAKRLDCKTVFGGPHVTHDLCEKYPFVDDICKGEGERTVVAILEGKEKSNGRIHDMDSIPSPYLDGVFNPLIKAYPDENWIALWETNRGCPFSCSFCDWGSATQSKVYKFKMDRLRKEVDWFADHKIEYVYCCDANFGMLPRDLELAQYVAQVKRDTGYPHKLSVQNTKNSTERSYAVQKLLSDEGLNQGVTVSMQSLDKNTLKSIKRQNISTESFETIQKRFTKDGVYTYTDLILGLPGETYDSFLDGTIKTIEGGQHNRIQFNNLSILPGAEMADPEYQKKYGMVTIEANIVNAHGKLEEDEVQETQILVVGTNSMPKEDWVKTRAMTWMISLLYFDKLLIIPLTWLHNDFGRSYKTMFEDIMESKLPIMKSIREFFLEKARNIQQGGEEFCESKEWLGIWWPADEYMFIKLTVEGKINSFYEEFIPHLGFVGPYIRKNKKRLKQPDGDLDKWLREVVWWGNKKGDYLNASG